MKVHINLLEYNNGFATYVKGILRFFEGTAIYLEGVLIYTKVKECIQCIILVF